MKRPIIALACLTAVGLLAGCETVQNGVANGGDLGNIKRMIAENKVRAAECNDPQRLFLTPDKCTSECIAVGSPEWVSTINLPVSQGYFLGDRLVSSTKAAIPFHLIGDKKSCLQDCKVNTAQVQACKNEGFWHADKIIRHYRYLTSYSNTDAHYKVEAQPTFDPAYSNQSIVVAIANEGGDVGMSGPLDSMTASIQATADMVASRPIAVSALNALAQALGRSGEVHLTLPVQTSRSFIEHSIHTLNKNPSGVQWPMTFDGNIIVDQSIN
jgi:hypothetical protein